MNRVRYMHASCAVGDYVYAIGGINTEGNPTGTFERLDASKTTSVWELIENKGKVNFTTRYRPVAATINDHEIVVLGMKYFSGGTCRSGAFIIDHTSKDCFEVCDYPPR